MPRSTLRSRNLASTGAPIDILVLTKGRELLSSVLSNAGHGLRVHHAPGMTRAEEIVQAESVGVLVTNALPESLPRILPRLRQWNPNLVVVAVGGREQGDALMRLAERGEVFRFLLQPVSGGQLGLYLDAAVRSYLERLQSTVEQARALRVDAREPRQSRSALPFSLAATIFLGSISGFFLLQQQDPEDGVGTAKTLELDPDGHALARALAAAERAREERRFVEPPADNAHYYYKQILAIAPHHPEAARGINDLVNLMFLEAETALREQRFESAREALARARRIAPSHPRLGVIGSQVDSAEQLALLDAAHAAAARGNFVRAERLLTSAADSRLGETSQVRETRARVRAMQAQNAARRAALVEAFARSLAEDRLLAPREENARDQLRELESLGAPEEVTGPMRADLAAALTRRVEQAVDARDIDGGTGLLEALEALGGDDPLMRRRTEGLAVALADVRAADLEAERLLDLAMARLDEQRLIAPAGDNAATYVTALRRLDLPPPGTGILVSRFGEQLVAAARRALAQGDLEAARRYLDEASALEVGIPGLTDAEQAYLLAQDSSTDAASRLSARGASAVPDA